MRTFGGPGVALSNSAIQGSGNEIQMQAGQAWLLSELANGNSNAGTFRVTTQGASRVQVSDPITGVWRGIGPDSGTVEVYSEGNYTRLANQSGCAIGAYVTGKGSGYSTPPSVLASAGNSIWAAIIGGVLTGVNVINGGSSYQYPPLVLFDVPPGYAQTGTPGFMATGYATLTNGVVSGVTLTDQGAGYTSAPNVYFINDPRDSTGNGAMATAVVGGAGQLTGVVCLNHGTPITGTTLPTLTISGGGGSGGAATVIMDWAITGVTVGGAGTGFPASSEVLVQGFAPVLSGAAWTNPSMETSLLAGSRASLLLQTTGGGGLTATGAAGFGGAYPAAVSAYGLMTSSLITGGPTLTFTMGGISDTAFIAQI